MRVLAIVLAAALGACATSGGDEPIGPPSLEVSQNVPAPAQAEFYANCIAQAAAQRTYFRDTRLDEVLRFNCTGDVAERFFAGLAERSAEIGSEMVVGIRTWRFTNRIQRDTIGLDYCWRDAPNTNAEPIYECTVVLNVGDFLKD
jgi:hypothetical protein